MTTDPAGARESAHAIPEWTLGWRLQRSLAHAGMRVEDMAQELEVSRATISRWINDRGGARKIYLRQWALRTGVPFEWIETGAIPGDSLDRDRTHAPSASDSGSGFYTPRYPTASSPLSSEGALADVLPLRNRRVSNGNGSSTPAQIAEDCPHHPFAHGWTGNNGRTA